MDKKIKVIYDISCFGVSAAYGGSHETGVGRVARNLLTGLIERQDVTVSLASSHHVYGGTLYAQAHGLGDYYGQLDVFPGSWLHRLVPYLYDRWQVKEIKGPAETIPYHRRLRRFLWHRICRIPIEPFSRGQLKTSDIFHSSHYPLPDLAKNAPHLRQFITVCDLIPLLRPDLFDTVINGFFKNVIASIHRDTWVIAISESTKKDVCNLLKIPDSQVFVAHLAAEKAIFFPCPNPAEMMEVRQRYGILENPYFLSVCTLEPRKNLASVVRAFCDLVRQNKLPDLKLVLVGIAGWKPERMNEALESAGELRSRIIITGYVPDKDLSPLYSGAMGFVYLSEYEGFGLPPLEAMQCGVPVITSNTSSLPEVVGDAGVMLDPNDIRGLTETLLDLYLHEDRRQELARRSKVRAACFSWDRCVSQVVEAYRAALNAGR